MGKLLFTSVPQDPMPMRQQEPQSRRRPRDVSGNPDIFSQSCHLNSAAPATDALHVAENYFRQVNNSSPDMLSARNAEPTKLFKELVDDTHQALAGLVTTRQRTTMKDLLEPKETKDSEGPPEVKSVISLGQPDIRSQPPAEFSLDDSQASPLNAFFSTPQTLSDRAWQAGVQGRNDSHESSMSQEGSPQTPKVSSLEGLRGPLPSEELDAGHGEVSKSRNEWSAVLRRSKTRSLDAQSFSNESFKTTRSGLSSTSSYLSDEAISERAAVWGNGVANLVLKNSSRDSTPRTSTGSSIDSMRYTGPQKVSAVSPSVKDALTSVQLAFVLCDSVDAENPILYASAGFFRMTGYSVEEVVGRTCLFLQGVDTDRNELAKIRVAVKNGEAYTGTLLNYKKNGSPFWNLLTLSPISDDKGVVIKYMGMQAEVSNSEMKLRRKEAALDTDCKAAQRSSCHSIAEADPSSNSQSKRSERDNEVPVFGAPSAKLPSERDTNATSRGSNRYSLTYGNLSRPMESWSGRHLGGSERHSRSGRHFAVSKIPSPAPKNRSLAPQQKPGKNNLFRPVVWLLSAARIIEEEIEELTSSSNSGKNSPETISKREERKGGERNKNKAGKVAIGVIGLLRKLERKLLNRKSTAVASNQVNAYNSESESDIDDLPDFGATSQHYSFDRQNLRTSSMPHITSTIGGPSINSLRQGDLGGFSSRYFSSALSDRFERKQFCIVHD